MVRKKAEATIPAQPGPFLLAAALLLTGCASTDRETGRYLLTAHTHHEQVTWGRFTTLEACEEARHGIDPSAGAVCIILDE